MAKFIYKAKDTNGNIVSESVEARDRAHLTDILYEKGLLLVSAEISDDFDDFLDAQKSNKFSLWSIVNSFFGVPVMEKVFFARHLSVMIGAGTPITKAIKTLSRQTKNKRFSIVLQEIVLNVQKGVSLTDCFAKFPNIFDDFFVNMVRVGETGGNLEEVLNLIADQLKKERDLLSKIRGAMIYPAVILTAMISVAILMMIFVLPNLVNLFDELKVDLPFTTRLVLDLSRFMQHNVFTVLFGIFAFLVSIFFMIKTKLGKIVLSCVFLHLPFFKEVTQKVNNARFARILSSLIEAGVSIVQALNVTSTVLGNFYYKNSLTRMASEIQKGKELNILLEEYPNLYPGLVMQMIEIGEETGTLSDVLKRLASFYEDDVDEFTKNISSIIEPILMLIIGGAVGFFAVSMIQPMYSVMSGL